MLLLFRQSEIDSKILFNNLNLVFLNAKYGNIFKISFKYFLLQVISSKNFIKLLIFFSLYNFNIEPKIL